MKKGAGEICLSRHGNHIGCNGSHHLSYKCKKINLTPLVFGPLAGIEATRIDKSGTVPVSILIGPR